MHASRPSVIVVPVKTSFAAPQVSAALRTRGATPWPLLAAVRQGSDNVFPENPCAIANAGRTRQCGQAVFQARPAVDRQRNSTIAGSLAACYTAPSLRHAPPLAHQTIPVSRPSPEVPARAAEPTLFDIVRKKLEDHINRRAYFIREPLTLMFSGLSGNDPEQAENVPGTIHLIFDRNTVEDPVELRIVITYSKDLRSESPIWIFEKSPRSDGEELLEARILFDAAALATDWLLHPLKHNQPMRLQTGRPQCYEWRRNIAASLTPPMEPEELGARIAGFCLVKTMQPIDLSSGNKRPCPDVDPVEAERPAARKARSMPSRTRKRARSWPIWDRGRST